MEITWETDEPELYLHTNLDLLPDVTFPNLSIDEARVALLIPFRFYMCLTFKDGSTHDYRIIAYTDPGIRCQPVRMDDDEWKLVGDEVLIEWDNIKSLHIY